MSTIEHLIARTTALETAEELQPQLAAIITRLDRMEQIISDMADTVMTTAQVAEMLDCDAQTVLAYIKNEGLEAVKRGRTYYCRRSRVLQFLTSDRGARLAERLRNRRTEAFT